MRQRILLLPVVLLLLVPVFAQQNDPGLLTVDSLSSFRTRSLGPVRWQEDGSGYLALEPSPSRKDAVDLVRYDINTGDRSIKIAADKLVPSNATEPLVIEEFTLTPDEKKVLIFTNSAR